MSRGPLQVLLRRLCQPFPFQPQPGCALPKRHSLSSIPVHPHPAWLPASQQATAVPITASGLALLTARPPQSGPLTRNHSFSDAHGLRIPVQREPPTFSGVSSRGGFSFRLLFSAVQQLPLLSAPFPGTFRGQLCGLQLGLLASPQAPHQPCPAQPERTETAALLTARGSTKYPQQLRGALTPQRQPLH